MLLPVLLPVLPLTARRRAKVAAFGHDKIVALRSDAEGAKADGGYTNVDVIRTNAMKFMPQVRAPLPPSLSGSRERDGERVVHALRDIHSCRSPCGHSLSAVLRQGAAEQDHVLLPGPALQEAEPPAARDLGLAAARVRQLCNSVCSLLLQLAGNSSC